MFKKEFIKLKWISSILVFLVGCIVLCVVLKNINQRNQKQVRTITQLNAMTFVDRMVDDLHEGISVTDSLEEILVSNDGRIDNFDVIAEDLMNDSIQSIQLAPNGVVTDIYPEKGNETGKIDLINDEQRGEISRYARDNNLTILQGPFSLKQGGDGIAIRNPVYLKNADGQEYFWGFTIAIIRVPEIFSNSIKVLKDFDYDFCLSKTESPLSSEYKEVYASGAKLIDPVSYEFEVGGCSFKLEVMPSGGWNKGNFFWINLVGGLLIIVLLSSLTGTIFNLDEKRKEMKALSITDPLTGLFNRNGFDEALTKYFIKNPKEPCVGVQLDIDDFKLINDVYGHKLGDQALCQLAQSMRDTFEDAAILGRNGGDEFIIVLKRTTCREAREKIEAFTSMPRYFQFGGEEHAFHISVGYAEYPTDVEGAEALIQAADSALYEVKLRGKANCLRYQQGFRPVQRIQLGFGLRDISTNLPGAFLIYRADLDNDQLLYANQEMVTYAGCKDLDDFATHYQRSFRNLIRPDERGHVENSIWEQIHSGNSGDNDYVQFHFVKKDGTEHPVLDHGRIVESAYYGKVFYVLIMDCALIEEKYK